MAFKDQEYFEVIEKNEIVKKAFENIKQICIDLQNIAAKGSKVKENIEFRKLR